MRTITVKSIHDPLLFVSYNEAEDFYIEYIEGTIVIHRVDKHYIPIVGVYSADHFFVYVAEGSDKKS